MTPHLDELLARWADQQRLTDTQAASIRRAVLRSDPEPAVDFDVDWFWSLLRPVMDLIPGAGPLAPVSSSGSLPYLRLV